MVQVSRTLLPLRTARKSDGGFGNSNDGGCGGAIVAQAVSTSSAHGTASILAENFMRKKTD
jgi:hypothetical protein